MSTGEQLCLRGIARACSPQFRHAILEHCRFIAEMHAAKHGTVTADDVRLAVGAADWEVLGNGAGAIFRSGEFVWTGEVRQSTADARRTGLVRIWRLRK